MDDFASIDLSRTLGTPKGLSSEVLDAASKFAGSPATQRTVDTFRALRRKAASSFLEDATLAWMARLPRDAQPRALARRYVRIANRLAAIWKSGHLVEAYLDDLLVDRRGNREGFPSEITAELKTLARFHHARQQAGAADPWASERLSKF